MPTVTLSTELQLIENLPSIGTISNTDLALIQTSVQSYKTTFQNLVANIPDNTTIETNPSGKLRVRDASTTFSKIQNITGPSVIGRTDSGSGVTRAVTIDTDLNQTFNNDDSVASSKAIKDYVDTAINTIDIIGLGQSYEYVSTNGQSSPAHNTSDRSWFAFIALEDNEEVYYRASPSDSWVEIWLTTSDRGPASLILPPNSQCCTDRSRNIFVLK
jgi:hypothetical protein